MLIIKDLTRGILTAAVKARHGSVRAYGVSIGFVEAEQRQLRDLLLAPE